MTAFTCPSGAVENWDRAVSKIEIVSMPTRETTSVVARDGQGNITRATQIESDITEPTTGA
jgi:hypothetical protein